MKLEVTLKTSIEFDEIDDENDAYNIICNDMSPDEILELAQNQGNTISVNASEY